MTATAVSEVDGGGPFAAGWVGGCGGGSFHGSGPFPATAVEGAAASGPFTATAVGVDGGGGSFHGTPVDGAAGRAAPLFLLATPYSFRVPPFGAVAMFS